MCLAFVRILRGMREERITEPQRITEHLLRERRSLTAYVCSITRNYHLAEDVYQEICVKAIGHGRGFDSQAHLVNWFRICARNRAIDIMRTREGRYVGLSEHALEMLEQDWDDEPSAFTEERLSALEKCLGELTPRSREIVRMRYFEDKPAREIATLLRQKIESAYQAIARIHKSLGDCVRMRMESESS